MRRQYTQIIAVLLVTSFLVLGCQNDPSPLSSVPSSELKLDTATQPEGNPEPDTELSPLDERDAEILRFVVAEFDDRPGNRIYFLTTTPMENWTETGGWNSLPDSFHDSIAQLQTKYRPAREAHLRAGRVLERNTDAEAWMRWVTIVEWKSDTEVTIEDGVWCCPLGGGASTTTYEKIDGKWRFKEMGPGWIS